MKPDLKNWTLEDFDSRADEVCDYLHSRVPDATRMISPAEYRLMQLASFHGTTRAQLHTAVREARAAGASWDRIGSLLDLDADEAEQRHGASVPASATPV